MNIMHLSLTCIMQRQWLGFTVVCSCGHYSVILCSVLGVYLNVLFHFGFLRSNVQFAALLYPPTTHQARRRTSRQASPRTTPGRYNKCRTVRYGTEPVHTSLWYKYESYKRKYNIHWQPETSTDCRNKLVESGEAKVKFTSTSESAFVRVRNILFPVEHALKRLIHSQIEKMSDKQSSENDHSDDLYGDLDNNVHPHETSSEIKSSAVARSSSKSQVRQINIQQEREEIDSLKKEVERLKKENESLKRNMGTLYRTAKKELKRKDDSIMRMKMEIDSRKL